MEIPPSPDFGDNFDRDSDQFEFSPLKPPDYDYFSPEEKLDWHLAQKQRRDQRMQQAAHGPPTQNTARAMADANALLGEGSGGETLRLPL